MKLVTSISIIGILACCCCRPDYRVCTDDSKIVVDDIFMIAEAIEQNPWTPPPEVFKNLLLGLQKLLGECFLINIDLAHYDLCVNEVLPVLPYVKKLIEDIQNGRQSEIIIDISHIALVLTDALSHCINHGGHSSTFAVGYRKITSKSQF